MAQLDTSFAVTGRALSKLAAITKDNYREYLKTIYLAEVSPEAGGGRALIFLTGSVLLVLSDHALTITPESSDFLTASKAVDMAEVSRLAPATKWPLADLPCTQLPEKAAGRAPNWDAFLWDLLRANWWAEDSKLQSFEAVAKPILNLGALAEFTAVLKALGSAKSVDLKPRLRMCARGNCLHCTGTVGQGEGQGHYVLVLSL